MVDDLQQLLRETRDELEIFKSRVAELETRLSATTQFYESQTLSLKQLTQRLEILHQLDQAILSADSLENLAQMALNHVIQLIPCFRASISSMDLSAKTIYMLALHSEIATAFTAGKTYPLDETYISAITNDPWVIVSELDQSKNSGIRQLYDDGIRSILLVPLRVDRKLIGLLNLHSVHSNYFTEATIQIVLEIAHQIAIGIDKKILSDAVTRYAKRMDILHAIDLGLIQGGSVKNLVANTLKQLQYLIPCERIGVGVIEHSTQEVIIYTSHFDYTSELSEGTRIPIPPNWFQGFDSSGIRLINNLHLAEDPPYKRLVAEGFQSQLQILLRGETGNLGVMGFSSKLQDFFTPEHQEVAAEVANQLSIAIHQMLLSTKLENYAAELEQRVAERTSDLQISKNQIEAILHNSLDGILLIDRDLRIQQANPAVSRLLLKELDHKEVINLLDLIHPDYANHITASIQQALLEQITLPVEVQANNQEGQKRDIELSFGYIPGDGFVSTLHDITTRKQAEELLKQALDKERELVKSKSHFISVASHEFRTPLASILAAADTLLSYRDRLNTTQIDQKLERITQNVKHMTAIMEDTLQLTRIQAGLFEFHPILGSLDALCRDIIDEFEGTSVGQGRIIYSSTASNINVMFDQRLMKQVIINLFSNALKYSPADKMVTAALVHDASQIIFSVSDQGIGIPNEDLKNLFKPFHRASNTGSISGTGLGLNITQQIVEHHGGEIKVESQVGQGTTFSIILPILGTA